MALKAGIVGLPNVGKSSLFYALTKYEVEASNYAFTTIEPNVSSVALRDKRLYELAKLVKPQKVVPATFDFVDIAGLVKGASKGEGLGNKFLANIREVNAIIHVVRCFEDKNIMHVANEVNPANDVEVINSELMLADLETINNVINRIAKKAKSGSTEALSEYNLALKIRDLLENSQPARILNDELNDDEKRFMASWHLLSAKPVLYVANMSLDEISDYQNAPLFNQLQTKLANEKANILPICVQLEVELATIEETEAKQWLSSYNIEQNGLDLLVQEAFSLLGLATYFTAGEVEVRAWVYKQGMLAPACAGIIHSDFENKFIKADIISYDDFIHYGSEVLVKSVGKIRSEGKKYVMKDGDICHFKFNR